LQYVIIGNSAAGTQAAETIRKYDSAGNIVIISDEPHAAYSRCLLPDYLAGERSEKTILFKSANFYGRNNVATMFGKKAVDIDSENQKVYLGDGHTVSYDKLLIATGSSAFVPPIKGIDESGIFNLRNLDDAVGIKEAAKKARRVVVVGGGFVGLEAAYSLYSLGLEVTVVERLSQIVPGQFDVKAAAILRNDMQAEGIRIITGDGIKEIAGPSLWNRLFNKTGKGVLLDSGERLKCELVVVATGTRANVGLTDKTGIKVNRGIEINEYMETNVPNIYAAGDVAETVDVVSGELGLSPIWPNAIVQGRMAGLNMVGQTRKYSKMIGMQNSVEFRNVPAIAIGLTRTPDDCEEMVIHRPHLNYYRKLILKDDILKGMIFVGDIRRAGVYAALIKKKVPVTKFKQQLLKESFGYSSIIS